jgi:hypothetical protein
MLDHSKHLAGRSFINTLIEFSEELNNLLQ